MIVYSYEPGYYKIIIMVGSPHKIPVIVKTEYNVIPIKKEGNLTEIFPVSHMMKKEQKYMNDSTTVNSSGFNSTQFDSKSLKDMTKEKMQKYAIYQLKDASQKLGVCPTQVKHVCRKLGIGRWPQRHVSAWFAKKKKTIPKNIEDWNDNDFYQIFNI